LFFYLRKNENGTIYRWLKKLFKNPFGLLLIILSFVLEATLVNPESYEMYALTLHGFILGMLAFLFGFIFIYSGETFWPMILKWRWLFIVLALILFLVRYFIFELKAPNYYLAVESCFWIFSMFGFAYRYLNHSSYILSYLSQGAYPIYIIHMIFIYVGSILILPLHIQVILKFILLVLFTFAGSFLLYDLVLRRISFLRPLFGLKGRKK